MASALRDLKSGLFWLSACCGVSLRVTEFISRYRWPWLRELRLGKLGGPPSHCEPGPLPHPQNEELGERENELPG